MSRLALLCLASAVFATQAGAQTPDPHAAHRAATPAAQPADPHAGHNMPAAPAADPHAGHTMPAAPATDPHAGHMMTAPPATAADPHAGHVMPAAPAADPHAGHVMPGAASVTSAAQLPVGSSPPPPPPTDNLADSIYSADQMARARDLLREEHGGARLSQVMANLAEYQSRPGGGGYRWDVEGWWGGDINRFVLKSEGEGGRREGVHEAEIQALFSRAVTRYTDLQIGLRHDLEPRSVTYLTLGAETLFPYWFDAEGALFLSQDGDLLGRVEGSYDFRLTQRLILQPSAELEFAAQDVRASDIGSGLYSAELGLRLRYEIRREFAPYIGVSYERSLGRTADFARGNGEDVGDTRFVAGLRAWF
ncbi:copper resistance protein B [Phenylobacterium sp.]|uniref:copper resistance protein B n=1 Tax=Phenylobacterium sp. TaxID=1871053 RepID=UPI003983B6A3